MRVYNYTKAKYALETLRTGHIKISTVANLNDPFELLALTFETREERKVQRQIKAYMDEHLGLLCLSESGAEPVMWSHYGDCHRGIAFAFDIDEATPHFHKIRYSENRIPHRLQFEDRMPDMTTILDEVLYPTLTTKSVSWAYEREWRKIVLDHDWIMKRISQPSDPKAVYAAFYEFSRDMRLAEVILGPDCKTTRSEAEQALSDGRLSAKVIKTRRAFKTFSIVPDQSKNP
ncbi:DUF2971 domain-containing protein [Caballeronia mineralivorans]|jgi:hypothetical protein|uniref:DUF2971 domain-containing protein n=1 Tax=Caballeronia mineralivorans TaxID=2010198 RepID=UPI0023F14DD5|nr:DUF2971 domain-containing protein [Caballeronia mineralivorans]MDB5788236.1 hypothetical protein [Caballeronia mineralivorans]